MRDGFSGDLISLHGSLPVKRTMLTHGIVKENEGSNVATPLNGKVHQQQSWV